MSGGVPAPACAVGRDRDGGLDVIRISNDVLQLAFLPEVGGRLISLRVAGHETLWRNPEFLDGGLRAVRPRGDWPVPDGTMASWANVGGSKTWPAPQGWSGPGEWPGPPDAVLDGGTYDAGVALDADGAARVTLTSPVDDRSGLQVARAVTLPPVGTGFTQVSTFSNRSARTVRWSIWEVAQIDTTPTTGAPGGVLHVAATRAGEPLPLIAAYGELGYTVAPDGVEIPAQDAVGKLGFPDATGRIEWRRADGLRLAMDTARRPDGEYPDGGCPVEVWVQCPVLEPLAGLGGLRPDAHVAEMEVLSPLATLAPGESTELRIDWSCGPPGPTYPPPRTPASR